MAAARRRKIGHRRRVEDEGEDEGGPNGLELDDDSMTDGSSGTDDGDDASDDSDTSNIDEMSPTAADGQGHGHGHGRKTANGAAKVGPRTSAPKNSGPADRQAVTDTDMMLNGLSLAERSGPADDAVDFDQVSASGPKSPSAPVVVSSASAARQQPETAENRRRQEHDNYRRKRDEDPAFVPNRGSFFMHDHRHAGPAANGFRPFGRGRGRGGFGGGVGGPFSPINSMHRSNDPTTNSQWTHDMHDTVAEPTRARQQQQRHVDHTSEGPANGNGYIPTRQPNPTPINRTLSTEKHIGNAHVRVLLPQMQAPIVKSGLAVKQYTKLPDHRPPLRRDKPVRISLPDRPPRYVYPAVDRSFVFIPRALRPNQQRTRGGKPRSGYGSVGGFSRRTSVFGGSYYGSMYSPSVAMSRRSSFAHDRESTFSPAGSVMSRAAVPVDNPRPVVRLPPAPRPDVLASGPFDGGPVPAMAPVPVVANQMPHPQAPMQENRPTDIPIHQPRPQKNISVADIESPALSQGPQSFQQPFHQQMPVQVSNGYQKETHSRQPSHLSHPSVGTPLSQIPERAIHAAPFQPNVYGQPPYYPPPYQGQAQQPYYYPQGYSTPTMPAQAPVPQYVGVAPQQPPHSGFPPQGQPGPMAGPHVAQGPPANNLVAQEANGMVYYYDASQISQMNTYQPYSAPPNYQPGVMGMGGMVTPSPDGYYYPQAAPGMVYYS